MLQSYSRMWQKSYLEASEIEIVFLKVLKLLLAPRNSAQFCYYNQNRNYKFYGIDTNLIGGNFPSNSGCA